MLRRGSAAAPALHGDNLEVHRTQIQTSLGPRIEVVLNRDSAAGPCGASDGDVLVEGRRAHNGRLIDALVLPDGIGASVTGQRALLRAARRDSNVCFHHIVFYKRIRCPSVDGKAAETAGNIEGA